MSIWIYVKCDRCGERYDGEPVETVSGIFNKILIPAAQLREAARDDGWATKKARRKDDICPKCRPAYEAAIPPRRKADKAVASGL